MIEVFLKIVNMSISASYLVAAVLLLRLVLKKAPKWVNVLLWGIVAIRLIFPFSIESALSLIPSAETIPEQVISGPSFEVQTGIPQIDVPVNDYIGDHYFEGVTVPAEQGFRTASLLTAVWLAGVAGMLVYTGVSFSLLRRRVATAVRLRNNIYQSENVDSPFVLGFLGPKIYLPFRMEDPKLAHVIAHEQAHIQRKDHWWKPFGFVLLVIHWFNPLMWVGYILLCRDIELACDEKVIKEMDNETKADYTQALVDCSVNRRSIAACPLAFGEVGVKERVKTVMNYKKPAFWIVIAAVALCIVVAVSFLTNPINDNKEFDASLLEYPGLKWNMTPEEVKSALNLSDDQIVADHTTGNYTYPVLVVKDLTLFGYPLKGARFDFSQWNNTSYGLSGITAYFTEETDMTQVRDTMIGIYGDGDNWSGKSYTIDSEGQLQIVSEVKKNPNRLQHYWNVSGRISDIVKDIDEVATYYESIHPEATKETIEEYLEHVQIGRIGLVDTAKVDERVVGGSVATKNVVHFIGGFITWLMQAFGEDAVTQPENTTATDPTATEEPTMSYDLPWLCYPDISWGMEPHQVKEILGVTEEQILVDEVMARYVLQIKDFTFLGNEVLCGQFNFIASNSGQYHFTDVTLFSRKKRIWPQ